MPSIPIAEGKNVRLYLFCRVQDISARVTSAPIQPFNTGFPQSVHWLNRSKKWLGKLPGQRNCSGTSNGGNIQSHRNCRQLLHAVGQKKSKSAHDSEPRQLACKTLQSGRKRNTLGQQDESNQNDIMVLPEWLLFWAIRPWYTSPQWRRRAFWIIDHGKGTRNASVSQSTAQALEKNCC